MDSNINPYFKKISLHVYLFVDFVWQWQDEKNRWNPYSVEHSVSLELAKQNSDDSVDIIAAHRAYKIDLQTMEQSNVTTQVIRKVEREKIGMFKIILIVLCFLSNLHYDQICIYEFLCQSILRTANNKIHAITCRSTPSLGLFWIIQHGDLHERNKT